MTTSASALLELDLLIMLFFTAGCPGSNQILLLLRSCGALLPEVLSSERTELAHTIWDKMKEMGRLILSVHPAGVAVCFSCLLCNRRWNAS